MSKYLATHQKTEEVPLVFLKLFQSPRALPWAISTLCSLLEQDRAKDRANSQTFSFPKV